MNKWLNIYPNDPPDKAAKKLATEGKKKQKRNKREKKENEKPLLVFPTYKYSRTGLYESIILSGLPSFVTYSAKFDRLLTTEYIEESNRILRPPSREEYPYSSYEFIDRQELEEYLKRARKETNDSLYQKAKSIVSKYNDQDQNKLNLLAIDVVWSYFQDKFGTTHYLLVVGDNDSGKSSIGNTFESVGYRTVNMTSPTAANIFRVFGLIEAGQCTLILDEADKIDDDIDTMNILKSGYDYKKKVPKTNSNTWKQEFFYVYGLKIVIAEKSPSKFKAKGLLDRALGFTTYPGQAQLDIKEVTAGHERDPQLDQALNELLDFRKLMLVYRLFHFEDTIVDIDVGVIRRNRELCKPYIRLFYGSEAQKEVEETFQRFLGAKNDKKAGSIEAILIPVIMELVKQRGSEVASRDVWDFIKDELEGESNGSDEYRISDYTLYRNTITKILEDKFGAESKHTNKGNKVRFYPEKLQRIQKSYDTDIKIKTKLKGEGNEGSERYPTCVSTSEEVKILEDFDNGNGKDGDISKNGESGRHTIPLDIHQEPSLPSHPSPIDMSDEAKAARIKNYEEYHRKSLRASKAAAKGEV